MFYAVCSCFSRELVFRVYRLYRLYRFFLGLVSGLRV